MNTISYTFISQTLYGVFSPKYLFSRQKEQQFPFMAAVCSFFYVRLIAHSCQNTFYTLHDAFMSFLSMDSNESFSFSIHIHKLYRNGTVFCLRLCRKCTFSVHFCAFFVQTASSLQAPRLGFSLRNEARCLHCTTCFCLEQPYRNT